MQKTALAGCALVCGWMLAAAGCRPAAAAPRRTASAALPDVGTGTLTPPPTLTPSPTPSRPTPSATIAPPSSTPTLCAPLGAPGLDGRPLATATLPAGASVSNIRGREQSLPLDCESRSAVDWAAFFGVPIDELEFFHKLPAASDPNLGFVGDVRGQWGNLPPNAYGVYAGPVALLLRTYNLPAYGYRGMNWDQLRAELAAGRPAIVWVVGHISRSTPVTMTVTGGEEILAARYEHTVLLVGYDEKHAAVLDGSARYAVPIDAFLTSWGTLGNMAVVGRVLPARPDCAGGAVELIPIESKS